MSAHTSNHNIEGVNPTLGLVTVFASCMLSGAAGVYFEKVLKGSSATLWVRNVQLSFFSLFPALFIGVLWKDGSQVLEKVLKTSISCLTCRDSFMDTTRLFGQQFFFKLLVVLSLLCVSHTQTTFSKTLPPPCLSSSHSLSQCTSSTLSSQETYLSVSSVKLISSSYSVAVLYYSRHICTQDQSQEVYWLIQESQVD